MAPARWPEAEDDPDAPIAISTLPQIRMRIGVNTGEVLVGALRAGGAITAMGDVVNTASRLQTSAQPGEVVVGGATYAATHGVIAYEPPRHARRPRAGRSRSRPGPRSRRCCRPGTGPAARPCPSSGATPSWRCCATRSTRRSRTRGPCWCSWWATPASARPGWPPSWPTGRWSSTTRSCSRAGACPTARPTSGGRWPRRCARPASSSPPARSTRPASRTVDRVAQAFHLPHDDAEVTRVTNGILHLLGYEASCGRATSRAPARRRRRRSCPSSRRPPRNQPVVIQLSDLHWADAVVLELIDVLLERLARRPVRARGHRPPGHPRALEPEPRPPQHHRRQPRPARRRPPPSCSSRSRLVAPRRRARRAARPQRRQPVLPRGAGRAARRARGGRGLDGVADRRPSCTPCPTPCGAWWRPASTASAPTSAPCSPTPPSSAAAAPIVHLRRINEHLHPGHRRRRGRMAELVAKELFQLDGGHWSFRSDLVREVAYGTLTKADRARRHAGIASLDREAPRGRVVRRHGRPAGPPLRRGRRAGRRPRRRHRGARRRPRAGRHAGSPRRPTGPGGASCWRSPSGSPPRRWPGRPDPSIPRLELLLCRSRGAGRRVGPRPGAQVDAEQARRDAEALGETSLGAQGAPGAWATSTRSRGRPSSPSRTLAEAADAFAALGDDRGRGRGAAPPGHGRDVPRRVPGGRRARSAPRWTRSGRSGRPAARPGRSRTWPGSRSPRAAPTRPSAGSTPRSPRSASSATAWASPGRRACWPS